MNEKATKFFEISTVDLSYIVMPVVVKSMLEISQNFVTLSEYMNFTILQMHLFTTKLFTGVTEPHEDFFLFVSVYNFPAEKMFGYTLSTGSAVRN